MSRPVDIIRRRIMGLVALAGMAPLSILGAGKVRAFEPMTYQLVRVFKDQANAAGVGRACLHAVPGECDVFSVTDDLCNSLLAAGFRLDGISDRRLRDALATLQSQDFRAGRVVRVEGWILAETDIRLCALAALT